MFQAPPARAAVSLDDLIALNQEISALAKAGVPLERGLGSLSRDLPRRLGRITEQLAARLAQGDTLDTALAADGAAFPPVYRALVTAGLRYGRLSVVLDGLTRTARNLRDVQRTVFHSLLYPLGVVLLGYAVLVFSLVVVQPKMSLLYDSHPTAFARMAQRFSEQIAIWGPLVPMLAIVGFAVWWYVASRSLVLQRSKTLTWMPGVGRLIRTAQVATLADILALLLEQGVPLPEALLLSADTVGDPETREFAQRLSAAVARGETLAVPPGNSNGLTSLARWLTITQRDQRPLAPLVRHTADVYREQTQRLTDQLHFFLPALLMSCIGGTAALLVALSLFYPYVNMLKDTANFLPR